MKPVSHMTHWWAALGPFGAGLGFMMRWSVSRLYQRAVVKSFFSDVLSSCSGVRTHKWELQSADSSGSSTWPEICGKIWKQQRRDRDTSSGQEGWILLTVNVSSCSLCHKVMMEESLLCENILALMKETCLSLHKTDMWFLWDMRQ